MHHCTASVTRPIYRGGSGHKLQVVSSEFLSNISKAEVLRGALIVGLICLAICFSEKILMAAVGNTIFQSFRCHCHTK